MQPRKHAIRLSHGTEKDVISTKPQILSNCHAGYLFHNEFASLINIMTIFHSSMGRTYTISLPLRDSIYEKRIMAQSIRDVFFQIY